MLFGRCRAFGCERDCDSRVHIRSEFTNPGDEPLGATRPAANTERNDWLLLMHDAPSRPGWPKLAGFIPPDEE
jgi:hypothetical protein